MTLISTAARGSVSGSSVLSYVEFTAPVTISAASEGTAQDIVSSGAQTYLGTPVLIEFQAELAPVTFATVPDLFLILQDGATVLGRLAYVTPAANTQFQSPVRLARRLTPSAGTHTYKVTGWRSAGNNYTVVSGAGGAGTYLPGFIRISSDG